MTADEFRHTVTPIQNRLYSIALHITGNSADAKDALQDALVTLWEHNRQLSAAGNREAYCAVSVRNHSISLIRRRKLSVDLSEASMTLDDSDPTLTAEHADDLQLLRHTIDRLPEMQRQVMNLSVFAGCSNAEIAEITGLSDISVRVALSRSRKRLRELFNKINHQS